MLSRDEQPAKAPLPMFSTVSGIIIFFTFIQSVNALEAIDVTFFWSIYLGIFNSLKILPDITPVIVMLLPVPTLQGQTRFPYLKDIQYLGFDKRINYYKDLDIVKTL